MTNNTESLKSKSYKAFAWDFSGRIAGQSVGFIISIFLARLLSPADFGLLAMANIVIALASSLMDMGLGVSIIQRKDVTDAHYGSVFFFNITVGITLATVVFLGAPLIGLFYNNDQLTPMVRALSVLFILDSIGNVIRLKLRKDLQYSIPTQGGLIAAILSGAVGVTLALLGYGVWSLVIQSLISPIINNAYLFYRVKWRPKLIFQWQALKELWNFGFNMFLSGILDTLFNNADSIIIGKVFSPATLGYYFRARSLNTYVVQYSSGSIMSVLFPAFSKVQHNLDDFRDKVSKGYHLINLAAFFLTGLFFVIGEDLILLMFGAKWQPSVDLFRLIIVTAFAYPLSSILVNILSASGNSSAFLKLEIIKKIILGTSLGFGFIWGIKGYLICNIIAYTFAVYFNIIFAAVQLKVSQWWFLKITLPYLIVTILICGTMFFIQDHIQLYHLYHLIAGSLTFTLLFTATIRLLGLYGLRLFVNEVAQFKPIQRVLKNEVEIDQITTNK